MGFAESGLSQSRDHSCLATVTTPSHLGHVINMAEPAVELYFAFGSNLKGRRLQINCPSAQFLCNAKLANHELAFVGFSKTWGGASATIRHSNAADSSVWGAVWRIHLKQMGALDEQECIHLGIYNKITVTVTNQEGKELQCVTYARPEDIPLGPPSPQYLKVVLEGAEESQLPQEYIEELKKTEHNGHCGTIILSEDFQVSYP